MATGKHQLETLVRDRTILHLFYSSLFFLLDQFLHENLFTCQGVRATQAVDSLVPRGGGNPCTRIAGGAFAWPAFKCYEQSILQRILSQLKIPHRADQGGEDAIGFTGKGV